MNNGNRKNQMISFTVLLFLTIFTVANAGSLVGSKILQVKNNRIYFDVGVNEYIFENSFFTIFSDSESVFDGHIEKSFLGVSYSEFIADSLINLLDSGCYAKITPAEIDSLSTIRISLKDSCPILALPKLSGESRVEIAINSNGEQADITIALFENEKSDNNYSSYSMPAPFYAVLYPNLSKKVNRDCFLSTSLYYRFNSDKLNFLVGNKAVFVTSHLTLDKLTKRAYPFNISAGKKLIKENRANFPKIKISYNHKSLKKIGQFFADLLSRDKLKVSLTENDDEADLFIAYLPIYNSDYSVNLDSLLKLLKKNSRIPKTHRDYLKLINGRLDASLKSRTEDAENYYQQLINQSLIEDLGVFPLFRPRLFFEIRNKISNIVFDADNFIGLDSLVLLKLPEKFSGGLR